MLKIQEIREIIKLIDQSDIEEFTFEHDGSKLKLKKNGTVQVVQQAPSQSFAAPQAAIQPPAPQAQPAQPAAAPAAEQPAAAPAPQEDTSNLHKITSPMVGTFYASPSPESGPYVTSGSAVKADSVVCIVEAMKLFNEIEAEVEGEIVEVLAKDGQLVEFGQPLFLVKPR